MALLDHNEKKNTGKKLLSRGPKVEVSTQVNRNDIEQNTKLESNKETALISTTITEPVNIRVDNHIRNQIAALITMGHSDTQKEMVETLVYLYIENLEKNEFKRYEDLVDIYEHKDLMKHQKKRKK